MCGSIIPLKSKYIMMKIRFALFVILLSVVITSTAQNVNHLSFKVGVLNSTTKTQQINPTQPFIFGGFEPRTGGLIGLRYSHKLSERFIIGSELQYLLKGHTSDYPVNKIYSNHYLGISPFISFLPFAKAKSNYINCISPELSFDYNYSLGTSAPHDKYENIDFYKYEMGYSLKLSYQPARFGIQIFHFRSLTPFLKSDWGFDDLKYNFATGVSVLYKFGK